MQKARSLLAAVLGFASLVHAPAAWAQAEEKWPSRRVTFIVGYASGGFADNVARVLSRRMSEQWKQPVIVQNMAGAGGNIAARSVSMAAPDGYTLLATTTSLAINDTLYRDKGFRADGLIAAAIPVEAPELLVTNPKTGIKNFADLIAKSKTGTIYLGSSGIGSGSHISAEYALRVLARIDVKHIPFAGGNPAMLALMTGDITVMASTATAIPSIQSGESIGLAVGSKTRTPVLPNVPTYTENGLNGFTASSWTGLFAPKGTPEPVLEAINAGVNQALKDPETLRQLNALGVLPVPKGLKESEKFFQDEITNWEKMVLAIGLSG
jgi:tripartite-type tricarboxylate transporter receptor subunit TctC